MGRPLAVRGKPKRNIRLHTEVYGYPGVYREISYDSSIPLFSKESILRDIGRQNLAGKPCAIATISKGKIMVKWHVFHPK